MSSAFKPDWRKCPVESGTPTVLAFFSARYIAVRFQRRPLGECNSMTNRQCGESHSTSPPFRHSCYRKTDCGDSRIGASRIRSVFIRASVVKLPTSRLRLLQPSMDSSTVAEPNRQSFTLPYQLNEFGQCPFITISMQQPRTPMNDLTSIAGSRIESSCPSDLHTVGAWFGTRDLLFLHALVLTSWSSRSMRRLWHSFVA